jgi:hypothetical protein
MSYYAVIREAGPGWVDGDIAAQPDVADHAGFMNGLADEGVVLFARPLAGTATARLRALLVMVAPTETEIRHCLADDPWARKERLAIARIERWDLIVGAERLIAPAS